MCKWLTSTEPARALVFCLYAAGAIGCGGEVDNSPGTPVDTAPAGSNATTTGGTQSDGVVDVSVLADCGPGFAASAATTDRPCRFFVGTTCYSTQTEACGCVCPRNLGPVLCVADGNAYLPGTNAYGVWCEPRQR